MHQNRAHSISHWFTFCDFKWDYRRIEKCRQKIAKNPINKKKKLRTIWKPDKTNEEINDSYLPICILFSVYAHLYLWPESRHTKSSLHIQLIQMNFTLINGFYFIFIAFHLKSWFIQFMSRFSQLAESSRANKIWFRASIKFSVKLRSFQIHSMHSERMMLLKLHCINKCGDGRYVATTPLRQYLSLTANYVHAFPFPLIDVHIMQIFKAIFE